MFKKMLLAFRKLLTDQVGCTMCHVLIHKSSRSTICNCDGAFCSLECADGFWRVHSAFSETPGSRSICGCCQSVCAGDCWYREKSLSVEPGLKPEVVI